MQPDPDTPRLLDVIDIPVPCQVPWDSMTGDERIRFCGMCKKSVYDISDMSPSTAENFLQENLGSVCLTFIRRADGTIVTDTCPKILKPIRNCYRGLKQLAVLFLGAIFSTSTVFAQTNISQGVRTKGFVLNPNVWRNEESRFRFSIKELTTGEFALPESAVYSEGGKTFINERTAVTIPYKDKALFKRKGICIDGYTFALAFTRAKEWVAKHEDRIAESYFRLALKMVARSRSMAEADIQSLLKQYAALLVRGGRAKEAKLIWKCDVVRERRLAPIEMPKGKSMLGIDPEMLRPRAKDLPSKPR